MDDLHTFPAALAEPASHDLIGSGNYAGSLSSENDALPDHAAALPAGYVAQDDGIYYLREDENGDLQPEWICSPLALVGACRRADGRGWGRVVDVFDSDDRRHRVILDEASLNGGVATLLRPLNDAGLRIASGKPAKELVVELLRSRPSEMKFLRTSRTGWTDKDFDTFMMADGSVIGGKPAILESAVSSPSTANAQRGSLETWQREVAASCVGNPLMLLAVSQAFAGPLLAPLGMDGGGFHLRGASSCGKSTMLRVAASVWGSPKHVHSWRATDNGLEAIASLCSGGLLALDELHQVSPQVAGDVVYMLANGRGKQRMSASGKLAPAESWTVALLSSGEISLEEHLASGGKKLHAGQDIRLIDLEADGRAFGAFDDLHGELEGRLFADSLQRAAAEHYGQAGRRFVERLIRNIQDLGGAKREVDRFVQSVASKNDLNGDGQVLRALKRFAAAAIAGELATSWGLTGWKKGEALNGISTVANHWLQNRDVHRRSDIDAALARTHSFLSGNQADFAQRGHAAGADGWRDESWFYFLPEAWARVHGHDESIDAARLHKAAGVLKTDKGGTLQLKMGRDTEGRPKVYAVSARVLGR